MSDSSPPSSPEPHDAHKGGSKKKKSKKQESEKKESKNKRYHPYDSDTVSRRRRISENAPGTASPGRLDNPRNLDPSEPGPSHQYTQGEAMPDSSPPSSPQSHDAQKGGSKKKESKNERYHPYGSDTVSHERRISENAPGTASPDRIDNPRNLGPSEPGPSHQYSQGEAVHVLHQESQQAQSLQAFSEGTQRHDFPNPQPDPVNLLLESQNKHDLSPMPQKPGPHSKIERPSPYKSTVTEKRDPNTSNLSVASLPSCSFDHSNRSISEPIDSEVPTIEDLENIERSSRELIEYAKKQELEDSLSTKDSVKESKQPETPSPSGDLNIKEEKCSDVSSNKGSDTESQSSVESDQREDSEHFRRDIGPSATISSSDSNLGEHEENISHSSAEGSGSETDQYFELEQRTEYSSSSEDSEMDSEPPATHSPSYYLNLEEYKHTSQPSIIERGDPEREHSVELEKEGDPRRPLEDSKIFELSELSSSSDQKPLVKDEKTSKSGSEDITSEDFGLPEVVISNTPEIKEEVIEKEDSVSDFETRVKVENPSSPENSPERVRSSTPISEHVQSIKMEEDPIEPNLETPPEGVSTSFGDHCYTSAEPESSKHPPEAAKSETVKVEHSPEAAELETVKVEHSPEAAESETIKVEHSPEAAETVKVELSFEVAEWETVKVEHSPEAAETVKVEHSPEAAESVTVKVEHSPEAAESETVKEEHLPGASETVQGAPSDNPEAIRLLQCLADAFENMERTENGDSHGQNGSSHGQNGSSHGQNGSSHGQNESSHVQNGNISIHDVSSSSGESFSDD